MEIINEAGWIVDQIAVEHMALSDWGIVYERWVGLEKEQASPTELAKD